MLRVLTIKCKPLETVNWVEGGRGVNLQIFAMWGEREREGRGGRGVIVIIRCNWGWKPWKNAIWPFPTIRHRGLTCMFHGTNVYRFVQEQVVKV